MNFLKVVLSRRAHGLVCYGVSKDLGFFVYKNAMFHSLIFSFFLALLLSFFLPTYLPPFLPVRHKQSCEKMNLIIK